MACMRDLAARLALLVLLADTSACAVVDDSVDSEGQAESIPARTTATLDAEGLFVRASSGSVPGHIVAPAGHPSIQDPPVCTQTVGTGHAIGSTITLTPVVADGSFFVGWNHVGNWPGCSYVSGSSCTIVFQDWNYFVEAQFDRYSARVTKTSTASGSGLIASSPAGIYCGSTCIAPFARNTSVVLTAALNGNSNVTWSGCDSATATTCHVGINGARAVTAQFNCSVRQSDCVADCWSICSESVTRRTGRVAAATAPRPAPRARFPMALDRRTPTTCAS